MVIFIITMGLVVVIALILVVKVHGNLSCLAKIKFTAI